MSAESDRIEINTEDVWPDDAETNEGVVVNWFVAEGSRVDAGDDICEYQVEKVGVDVPAPTSGTLDEIVLGEDAEFERGQTLAWLRPD